MDFETDIEELAGQEVSPGGSQNIAIDFLASIAYWSGGKTHPRVGQAPRRRKVCADTAPTSRAAVAPIDLVDFMTNAVESEVVDKTLKGAIAVLLPKRCRRGLL
jgi:hypothetical protein